MQYKKPTQKCNTDTMQTAEKTHVLPTKHLRKNRSPALQTSFTSR